MDFQKGAILLPRRHPTTQRHFSSVITCVCGGATVTQWGEAREATKHHILHKTASHSKDYLVYYVRSVGVEEPDINITNT